MVSTLTFLFLTHISKDECLCLRSFLQLKFKVPFKSNEKAFSFYREFRPGWG
jgi:hypothetical protein